LELTPANTLVYPTSPAYYNPHLSTTVLVFQHRVIAAQLPI